MLLCFYSFCKIVNESFSMLLKHFFFGDIFVIGNRQYSNFTKHGRGKAVNMAHSKK